GDIEFRSRSLIHWGEKPKDFQIEIQSKIKNDYEPLQMETQNSPRKVKFDNINDEKHDKSLEIRRNYSHVHVSAWNHNNFEDSKLQYVKEDDDSFQKPEKKTDKQEKTEFDPNQETTPTPNPANANGLGTKPWHLLSSSEILTELCTSN